MHSEYIHIYIYIDILVKHMQDAIKQFLLDVNIRVAPRNMKNACDFSQAINSFRVGATLDAKTHGQN